MTKKECFGCCGINYIQILYLHIETAVCEEFGMCCKTLLICFSIDATL